MSERPFNRALGKAGCERDLHTLGLAASVSDKSGLDRAAKGLSEKIIVILAVISRAIGMNKREATRH
jgi:hypothetical protein